MTKIYFAASIRGGQQDREIYSQIINELQKHGQVLTEHIVASTTSHMGSVGGVKDIYKDDMNNLKQCDVMVAEVTRPSLGVGYEIAYGEAAGKKILCLYRPQKDRSLSAMIAGSPFCEIKEYQTIEEVQEILKAYFSGNVSRI